MSYTLLETEVAMRAGIEGRIGVASNEYTDDRIRSCGEWRSEFCETKPKNRRKPIALKELVSGLILPSKPNGGGLGGILIEGMPPTPAP